MDFLNKAYAQLADLFRSMTPGARITAGLLLLVVVISLAFLVNNRVTSRDDSFLLGGRRFTPEEMQRIEAAFAGGGLADYEFEGMMIRIPRGQQAAYMAALAEGDALPQGFGDNLLSAINASGPMSSKHEQQQRNKIALQLELARIIGQIDGISGASVMYDSRTRGGVRREEEVTASVAVQTLSNQSLSDGKVNSIRNLVASAIAGLRPDAVTITDSTGRSWSATGEDGLGSAIDDPYLARMREYKKDYETQVRTALSYIPSLTVTASVELDREIGRTEQKIEVDPKTIPIRTAEESLLRRTEGAVPAARPGLEAQRPNQGAQLALANNRSSSEEEKSNREEQNAASHGRSEARFLGLTPKTVQISVAVPSSYFEKIYFERNPATPGNAPEPPDAARLTAIETEVTEKIRSHVAAAILPLPQGVLDPTELVKVTTFQDFAPPPIAEPSLAETGLAWLAESWQTLGMLGLGLVSLVMLRSMIRSAGSTTDMTPKPLTMPDLDSELDAETKRRLNRFDSGPSLREELTNLVDEDMDAAANVLRGWIGDGK